MPFVGLQGHYNLDFPTTGQLAATIEAFSKLRIKAMAIELDLDVLPSAWEQGSTDASRNFEWQQKLNPSTHGLPSDVQQRLARRYADLFQVFIRHRAAISRVTSWGVTDGGSWLNDWPVKGRTNYPLLFDRNARPKPVFDAVIQMAQHRRHTSD